MLKKASKVKLTNKALILSLYLSYTNNRIIIKKRVSSKYKGFSEYDVNKKSLSQKDIFWFTYYCLYKQKYYLYDIVKNLMFLNDAKKSKINQFKIELNQSIKKGKEYLKNNYILNKSYDELLNNYKNKLITDYVLYYYIKKTNYNIDNIKNYSDKYLSKRIYIKYEILLIFKSYWK